MKLLLNMARLLFPVLLGLCSLAIVHAAAGPLILPAAGLGIAALALWLWLHKPPPRRR